MPTKLGRMVIYLERILNMKPYKALITWTYKATWQTKTCIFLLQRVPIATNLAGWWLTLMGSYLWSHVTLSIKSRDHWNNCMSNNTLPMATKVGRTVAYLEAALKQEALIHFDNVVLQYHVTNESHWISTTRVSMSTKRDRIVTNIDGILLICSSDPLISALLDHVTN